MKVKKTFLILALMIFATTALGQWSSSVKASKNITLTIDRHPGWMGDDTEGEGLTIRCTFENPSKRAVDLLLADHSEYSGTMPYPVGLKAKVTDTQGNVLTRTADFGDWWTSYYLSSSDYREMPGDRITLKPGQRVVRIVPLAEVLRGLRHMERLPAGEYWVQLTLEDIVSNEMKLKVLAAN